MKIVSFYGLINSQRKLYKNNQFFLRKLKLTFLKKLGFTPCKAEQPLQGMELYEKEKEAQKY